MGAVTAIELGPGSCVMARVRAAGSRAHVSAVYGLAAGDARPGDVDFEERLRQVRLTRRFPRRAHVVAWRVGDGMPPGDSRARLALAPFIRAGFRVETVLSPAQALATLAGQRPSSPGGPGEAWVALNTYGGAIAMMHDGHLVFSRVLEWNRRPAATTREELLERYLLVARLAPELLHGLDVVRARRGTAPATIVTCGDWPDLRSLTMPLIEELDMEVEALDSLDGLVLVGQAATAAGERPAALRLAAAAALAAGEPPVRASRALAAAAAIVLLAAGLWGLWQVGRPPGFTTARDGLPQTVVPQSAADEQPDPGLQEPAASPLDPPAVAPQASASDSASTARTPPERDPGTPAPTAGRQPPALAERRQTGAAVGDRDTPSSPVSSGAASRDAREPSPQSADGPRTMTPLPDPLPAVNSILVSPERRLAVLDGEVVREGDAVGRRVLLHIEPYAVVLKEPSGNEVRVPIRRRVTTPAR